MNLRHVGNFLFLSVLLLAFPVVVAAATVDFDILTFENTGVVDITDAMGVIRNTTFTTIYNQIKSGFNPPSPYWDGTKGITSSVANPSGSPMTIIGCAPDDYLKYTTTWVGRTFPNGNLTKSSSEVLLRYTLVGDANLNGQTSSTEVTICIGAYKGGAPKLGTAIGYTFVDGDINFDGKITSTDVTKVVAANKSGVTIPSGDDFGPLGEPVPEPATWIMILMALCGVGFYVFKK